MQGFGRQRYPRKSFKPKKHKKVLPWQHLLPGVAEKLIRSSLCGYGKQRTHKIFIFIYLGFLHRFQHCTSHITMGSWKGRGNQYIQFVRVLYCKLLTNSKQLPAFPLEAVPRIEPRPQRWRARVLPLCHRGPIKYL